MRALGFSIPDGVIQLEMLDRIAEGKPLQPGDVETADALANWLSELLAELREHGTATVPKG